MSSLFDMQLDRLVLVSLGAVLVFAPSAAADEGSQAIPYIEDIIDPDQPPQPVDPAEIQDKLTKSGDDGGIARKAPAAPGSDTGLREIGGAVTTAITENWALTGVISAAIAGLGFTSWFLASRYVDPKVALRNPQRSMLYGFVKGNPGVHLKQLSNEFKKIGRAHV